jgi:P-type Cu2+ transporter
MMAVDSHLLRGFADDTALIDTVTRRIDDHARQVDLLVPDMRCASCAGRIEAVRELVPGVRQIRVNAARQHVSIDYEPERTTLAAVLTAIEQAGYTPTFMGIADDDPEIKRQRRVHLKRLGVAGIAMMQIKMVSIAIYTGDFHGMESFYYAMFQWVGLLFCTPVVFYSSVPFFRNAWHSLAASFGRGPNRIGLAMDVPVALAIAIAYLASIWATVTGGDEVYYDSVAMFAFLLLGARYLEQSLRHRLARFDNMLALLPERVTRIADDGSFDDMPLRQVRPGDQLLIKLGARIPVDGEVTTGQGDVDESVLTGESAPVSKGPGDMLYAGTVNTGQALRMRARVRAGETRMAAIQRLAERATLDRPGIVMLTDRIARFFVVMVLTVAAITYLGWYTIDPGKALWSAIAVLVVACPCALSLATPSAITAATMALRRIGFVVTRGHVLDRLARATMVIFDKTGTLTHPTPQLSTVTPLAGIDAPRCLALAVALERETSHPLAAAFEAHLDGTADVRVDGVRTHPGQGVSGTTQGHALRLGQAAFCGADEMTEPGSATSVFLACDGIPICRFEFCAGLRDDAARTVAALERDGLAVQIFTGDAEAPAAAASAALSGVPVHARMTPERKLAELKRLQEQGQRAVMVGDGINDVPVLAAASVSIAPLEATDLAKNGADAILLSRGLAPLAASFGVARQTQRIIRQNLFWSLGYNVTTIPLAAFGMIPPWAAAIGMSASSLLVMLNSMRLTRAAEPQSRDVEVNELPAVPVATAVPASREEALAWKF